MYSKGTIYVGSDDDHLYVIDASSGAIDWTYTAGGAIAATPGVNDKGTRITVVSTDGTLAVLDSNGTELQTLSFPADSRSTPVIDGSQVFVGSSTGTVYAYE